MNTSHGMNQVDRYLRELSTALSALPEAERADIIAGVREHIDASLADQPGDADIERILRNLGDPPAIAADSVGRPQGGTEPAVPALRRSWVPPTTTLSLMFGSLFWWLGVPVVLWLAGIVLLWASALWRTGEKMLGTVVFVVAPPIVLGTGLVATRPNAGPFETAVLLVPYIVYVIVIVGVGAFLWRRGAARAGVTG